MDNLITAAILFVIASKSTNNRLTYLIITGCLVAWLIDVGPLIIEAARQLLYGELSMSDANEFLTDNDEFDFDIALYYSLNAILYSLLALSAVKLKSTSALFYAILMLVLMFFCLLLTPNWGEAGNAFMQNRIIFHTQHQYILLIALGVTGSDNTISSGFNVANNISCGNGFNSSRNDSTD